MKAPAVPDRHGNTRKVRKMKAPAVPDRHGNTRKVRICRSFVSYAGKETGKSACQLRGICAFYCGLYIIFSRRASAVSCPR